MKKDFWCIAFVSTAKKELAPEAVRKMIDYVSDYRRVRGNTGLTVFSNSNALIIIEGTKESAKLEYEEAIKDPHHHGFIKMYDGEVQHRLLEDFPFAVRVLGPQRFKELDTFESEQEVEFFNALVELDTPISRIIKAFIKNNS